MARFPGWTEQERRKGARAFGRFVVVLLVLAGLLPSIAQSQSQIHTDRLIVKLKPQAGGVTSRPYSAAHEARFSEKANQRLSHHREMSGGARVLKLDRRRSLAEVEEIARKLREDPEVEYAVPDRIAHIQLTPNDPQFANQWYLQPAAQGGINAPAAWDVTTGNASIVVAIIDTGIRPHTDLAGRTVPGYDFVSDTSRSNDGNGRDADPTDPGDWVTAAEAASGPLAGCPATNSSWHGTALAGIIGAIGNNATGIAGINWGSKILPVRAVGKCGGFTSDIVDAIRWAAGIPVSGVPNNANPAKVINLSIATTGTCDVVYQSAINEAVAVGATVVAAAGNQGQNAANYAPASCANVLAVGAVDRNGGLAAYSNTGAQITVSAPVGIGSAASSAVLSASDTGLLGPANDSAYLASQGTSLAAAEVSGVASLMLSVRPALTPAQLREYIRNTARAFPSATAGMGSYADCVPALCGGGILDASRALAAVNAGASAEPQLVAARGPAAVGLRSDGTVWTWGTLNLSPIQLPGPGTGGFLTDIVRLVEAPWISGFSAFFGVK